MALLARYGAAQRIVYRAILLCVAWSVVAPTRAAGPIVWAFGDSLTAGYGLPLAAGFPHQLELALRKSGIPANVRNGGISGDTAAQGRARLLWGLRGLGAKPDLVIVELGANDMLRGLPPAQASANLDRILAELQRRKIRVVLAGMKASRNLGPDYMRAFDAIYPALAAKYGIPLYPFFLDGVAGKAGLIQEDGLHPNARGVTIVVGRLLPLIRATLARPGA